MEQTTSKQIIKEQLHQKFCILLFCIVLTLVIQRRRIAQLIKAIKPWFNSRREISLMCLCEKHFMLFPTLERTAKGVGRNIFWGELRKKQDR